LQDASKEGFAFEKWTDTNGNRITEIPKGSHENKILSANWEEPKDERLHFIAGEPNSTIKLTNVAGTYKTSTNGIDWTDYKLNTLCTLTNVGDRIYFSARDKNENCYND